MKKLTLHTPAQEIREFLIAENKDGYELSPDLEEKLDKIEFCRELIGNSVDELDLIAKLRKEFKIGRTQAYNILYDTDKVFNKRQILIDKTFSEIQKSISIAMAKQDAKALAACIKNKIEAIKAFYGDKETFEVANIQPPDVVFLNDPGLVNQFVPNADEVLDITAKLIKMYGGDVTDANYENV